MMKNHLQFLRGSFSAVSTATIARKDAFCGDFRDLQDLHSFFFLLELLPYPAWWHEPTGYDRSGVSQKLISSLLPKSPEGCRPTVKRTLPCDIYCIYILVSTYIQDIRMIGRKTQILIGVGCTVYVTNPEGGDSNVPFLNQILGFSVLHGVSLLPSAGTV